MVNRWVFRRLRKVSSDGADVTSGGHCSRPEDQQQGSVANGGPVGLWLDKAASVGEAKSSATL